MADPALTRAVRRQSDSGPGSPRLSDSSADAPSPWQDAAHRQLAFPAGAELFGQGIRLSDVFVLEEGSVKLVRSAAPGCDLIVDFAQDGALLGAPSVIAGEPTPTSAVAMAKCRVRLIPRPAFLDLLRTKSEISGQVHRAHAAELCSQMRRIADLSLPSRRRLEKYLLSVTVGENGAAAGRSFRVALPMKHHELASFLGTTPENLSRLFRALEDEGSISIKKRWVIIDDIGRLMQSHASDRQCGTRVAMHRDARSSPS